MTAPKPERHVEARKQGSEVYPRVRGMPEIDRLAMPGKDQTGTTSLSASRGGPARYAESASLRCSRKTYIRFRGVALPFTLPWLIMRAGLELDPRDYRRSWRPKPRQPQELLLFGARSTRCRAKLGSSMDRSSASISPKPTPELLAAPAQIESTGNPGRERRSPAGDAARPSRRHASFRSAFIRSRSVGVSRSPPGRPSATGRSAPVGPHASVPGIAEQLVRLTDQGVSLRASADCDATISSYRLQVGALPPPG